MKIVSRASWGAKHERGAGPAPLPASEVWLHHSVTIAPDLELDDANRDGIDDDEAAAMRTLERIGEQRFGRGISYTFAVMPSGRVYEGHGVDRIGAHTARRNSIARAIVLVGDYSKRKPTAAQLESVAQLLAHGKRRGWWRAARLNGGHRQAPGASTACPGNAAQAAVTGINARAAALLRPAPPAPPAKPAPPPTPPAPPAPDRGDDVARLIRSKDRPEVYATDGVMRWHVPSQDALADLRRAGLYGDGEVHEVAQATIDALPLITP